MDMQFYIGVGAVVVCLAIARLIVETFKWAKQPKIDPRAVQVEELLLNTRPREESSTQVANNHIITYDLTEFADGGLPPYAVHSVGSAGVFGPLMAHNREHAELLHKNTVEEVRLKLGLPTV